MADNGHADYISEVEELYKQEDVYLAEAKTKTPITMLANLSRAVQPGSSTGKTDPTNYRWFDMKFIDSPGVKSQAFKCSVKSHDSETGHRLIMAFYDVAPGEKPNSDVNAVRVNCSCLSYYFYFGYYNWANDCHYGPKPRAYQKVPGSNRGSVNPTNSPGTCKHLNAFARLLQDSGKIK